MPAGQSTVIMFSVSALALSTSGFSLEGVVRGLKAVPDEVPGLALDWPDLARALPDGILPRGVIELAAMPKLQGSNASKRSFGTSLPDSMRGGATTIAVSALRALHASDEHAWAAWITPTIAGIPSLYAPSLAESGVDLQRLLVVRPEPTALTRTMAKVAASGAFGVVVVDLPQSRESSRGSASGGETRVVRKLALAAEEFGTISLLLTSALTPRSMPWPVALRLEVERRPDALGIRVTKDRRGSASFGSQHVVRLPS